MQGVIIRTDGSVERVVLPELTAEELARMESEARLSAIAESRRSLSLTEVTQMIVTQQINTLTVDDNTALRMKQFYPTFDSIIGQTVAQDFKFTYGDKLYKVIQPQLTIQEIYPPSVDTASLYTEINETHDGTIDDPIPYDGNMALVSGLYYVQDYVIYLCIRDTVNPVYSSLESLVGQYVEGV